MSKKIIFFLLTCGLASIPACAAETSVNLYGLIDATLDSVSAEGTTTPNISSGDRARFSRVNSNSSYLGIKGIEELGEGLSALFQFETGLNVDAGVYSGSGRDTFVGLKGNWGMVRLGNFSGPTRTLSGALDLLPGRTGIGTSDALLGKPLGGVAGYTLNGTPIAAVTTGAGDGIFDTRTPNTLSYATPTINGFNAVANYSASENRTNDKVAAGAQLNGRLWELGLNYSTGPLYVGYAYGKLDTGTDAIAAGNLQYWKSNRLGAGYTFEGGHKINFIWDKQQIDLTAGKELSRTGWSLQGLYKVNAAGGLVGAYTKVNNASGNYLANTSDTEAKQWTLGYLYSLSKRTTVKAVWTKLTNGKRSLYDFAANPVGGSAGSSTTLGAGANPTGYSIGLRHAF